MRNSTGYYLKQAYKNALSHKLMSIASICIITATLSLLGLFVTLGINASSLMETIGDSRTINVYLEDEMAGRTILEIEDELKRLEGVKEVTYYSAKDRMEKVSREVYGEETDVYEGEENPLRNSFVVTIDNIENSDNLCKSILSVRGIEETVRSKDVIIGINMITEAVKKLGIWIMAVLILLAVLILYNTIRMGIGVYNDEIKIMRIVGATEAMIRGPFVIQGLLIGMAGGTIASAIISAGYAVLAGRILRLIRIDGFTMASIPNVIGIVLAVLISVGSVIGVMGSGIAVSKSK